MLSTHGFKLKTMKEYKTAEAETHIEIWVHCPHCDEYQNQFEKLRESLDYNEPRAEECDAVIECEECHKEFEVTKITY